MTRLSVRPKCQRCLYCRAILPVGHKPLRFCSDNHKTGYYHTRREDRTNAMSPEEFIKRELDKPVPISVIELKKEAAESVEAEALERKAELWRKREYRMSQVNQFSFFGKSIDVILSILLEMGDKRLTVAQIAEKAGFSYQTTNILLHSLLVRKVLKVESVFGRNQMFVFDEESKVAVKVRELLEVLKESGVGPEEDAV